MIRENITVTIGNDSFSGELTAPSVVMTSKPQEEILDLAKTPNFVLKVEDTDGSLNVTDVVEVAFTAGDKSYTANAKVYNKIGKYVALQYMNGLTAEDAPETHTLEFDNSNYDTSYDINTGEKSQARFNVLYDGLSIHLESSMFSGLNYNKFEPIESTGGIFKAKDALPEISAGQTYVDNVTVTYEGLTASCTVTLTVTDSATGYHFSSPADGDTINGELDPDFGEFTYPIEVIDSDGNNISYDITSMCVTSDNENVGIGYTEDANENGQSYISGVNVSIYQAGSGTATLTFDDGEHSCTTTFTYNITEGQHVAS